ncbi:MAG: PTS sugar transporter subunit IIA [Clostridiales bacterium]|jgi:lichenan operon transcriptional antiterminator|nr:PTS sugar transporter subunit IIA [Clostridiales bacterium]
MTSKHRNLLRCFPNDASVITAGDLALRLDISVRSVKNYIAEIAVTHPNLISSSRKGYAANRRELCRVLSESEISECLPETPKQRVLYIIRRILRETGGVFTLADFEAELFVSEEALRKDLPNVRLKLKEFDLYLEQRSGSLIIGGDESNKRRMLSEIVYLEFNDRILSLSSISKAFPDYDANALKAMLVEVCNDHYYFINEYALMSLVLDLIVGIDRIKNNFFARRNPETHKFGVRELDLARTIALKIENLYAVTFNPFEMDELCIILFGHLTKVDYKALTLDNLKDTVGEESLALLKLIQQELDVFEVLDFENPDFTLRFALHLHNLLTRLKNKYVTKNPLTEQIKSTCTFIYELAVIIAGIINRETGYFVDQHETAYIALHIGSMLQIQQSLRNKAKCLLVYPNYYDYAGKLMEKLTQGFGASLVFVGVATNPESLSRFGAVDFILSTVKLNPDPDKDIVTISPFFSERDKASVQAALERTVKKKKYERLRKSLLKISSPDLFFHNPSFENEENAITVMANEFIKREYAPDDFLNAVLKRERSYSTSYGDVAVPHSLQMMGYKTGMCIAISERPVPWGANKVRIMLMFCVNKDDRQIFYDVLENLIVLLLEPANAARAAACRGYNEFVDVILQCLE